ncbi:uncharacterized protein [Apostichopus japonicus]|uniref:uncharacterized protein isoform X2 n=1 Tax=Stichopus japonicus TaxID=307972 RepID=UPI003AB6BFB2
MPRGIGGRLAGRKRKARKVSDSNAELINALKAGVSSAALNESNGDLSEFQASTALRRKRRKQSPEGSQRVLERGASQSVTRESKRGRSHRSASPAGIKGKNESPTGGRNRIRVQTTRKVKNKKDVSDAESSSDEETKDDNVDRKVQRSNRFSSLSPLKRGSQKGQGENGKECVSPKTPKKAKSSSNRKTKDDNGKECVSPETPKKGKVGRPQKTKDDNVDRKVQRSNSLSSLSPSKNGSQNRRGDNGKECVSPKTPKKGKVGRPKKAIDDNVDRKVQRSNSLSSLSPSKNGSQNRRGDNGKECVSPETPKKGKVGRPQKTKDDNVDRKVQRSNSLSSLSPSKNGSQNRRGDNGKECVSPETPKKGKVGRPKKTKDDSVDQKVQRSNSFNSLSPLKRGSLKGQGDNGKECVSPETPKKGKVGRPKKTKDDNVDRKVQRSNSFNSLSPLKRGSHKGRGDNGKECVSPETPKKGKVGRPKKTKDDSVDQKVQRSNSLSSLSPSKNGSQNRRGDNGKECVSPETPKKGQNIGNKKTKDDNVDPKVQRSNSFNALSPLKRVSQKVQGDNGKECVSSETPKKGMRGMPSKCPAICCPCCNRTAKDIFPDGEGDMNDHALICLHEKFNNDTSTTSNDKAPGKLKRNGKIKRMEPVVCQICNRDLTNISEGEQTKHVNRCIDAPSRSDVISPAETSQTDEGTDDDEEEDEREEVICQICSKNISHMNTRRRMQHVNRCIDSNLEVNRTTTGTKAVSPPPRTHQEPNLPRAHPVPKCIICGIPLNTQNKKRNHLKSCALKNNITTVQLLDMVKHHEVTGETLQMVQPLVGSKGAHAGAVTKIKKPRKKKEDIDENMQVAMAMSASIADQEDEERKAMGLPVLERFPDKASSKETKKRPGRPRKQTGVNFHPLLTRTEQENRMKWEEKIANVIDKPSEFESIAKTPQGITSGLAKRYSKRSNGTSHQLESPMKVDKDMQPMWHLTTCDALLNSKPFYVEKLLPFFEYEKEAKKTQKTLRFEDDSPEKINAIEQMQSPPGHASSQGVITQEAIIALAELMADDSQEEDPPTGRTISSPAASGFIPPSSPHKEQGIDAGQYAIDKPQRALLDSLRRMVDSTSIDPLIIRTKDNQMLFAHYFILAVRCPKLLEECEVLSFRGKVTSSGEISLLDYRKSELLLVMAYLYAGETYFPEKYLSQIGRFAKRYNLVELDAICQKRLRDCGPVKETTPSKLVNQEKDIQDLIQSIWDDNSDDNTILVGDMSSDSTLEELPNQADLTDIYEFAFSQKKGVKKVTNGESTEQQSSEAAEKGRRRRRKGVAREMQGSQRGHSQDVDRVVDEGLEENGGGGGGSEDSDRVVEFTSGDEESQMETKHCHKKKMKSPGRLAESPDTDDSRSKKKGILMSENVSRGKPASSVNWKREVVSRRVEKSPGRKPGRPRKINLKINLSSDDDVDWNGSSDGRQRKISPRVRRRRRMPRKQQSSASDENDDMRIRKERLQAGEEKNQNTKQMLLEEKKEDVSDVFTPRKRGGSRMVKVPGSQSGLSDSSRKKGGSRKVRVLSSQSGLSDSFDSEGNISSGLSVASPKKPRGRPRKITTTSSQDYLARSSQKSYPSSSLPSNSLPSGKKVDTDAYLLVQRRWSLRAPGPPETPEKGEPEVPSPKRIKRVNKGKKSHSIPERIQILKLATKKRGFKFKRKNTTDTNTQRGRPLKRLKPGGGGIRLKVESNNITSSSSHDSIGTSNEINPTNYPTTIESTAANNQKTTPDPFDSVWNTWNNAVRDSGETPIKPPLPLEENKLVSLSQSPSLFDDGDDADNNNNVNDDGNNNDGDDDDGNDGDDDGGAFSSEEHTEKEEEEEEEKDQQKKKKEEQQEEELEEEGQIQQREEEKEEELENKEKEENEEVEEEEEEFKDVNNANSNSKDISDSPPTVRVAGGFLDSNDTTDLPDFKISTPYQFGRKKDRTSQLKVNLGKKLNIFHLRTNNLSLNDSSDVNLDRDENGIHEVHSVLGKENMPEVVDIDVPISPVLTTPLSPLEPCTPTSSSPVFGNSPSRKTARKSVPRLSNVQDTRSNDEQGSCSSLERASPSAVAEKWTQKSLGAPSEIASMTNIPLIPAADDEGTADLQRFVVFNAGEEEIHSRIGQPEQVECEESLDEGNGDVGREDSHIHAVDFAEEFAFDQDGGFGDDVCLGVNEVEVGYSTHDSDIVSGVAPTTEEGTVSSIPNIEGMKDMSIDLTKDDDGLVVLVQNGSNILGEIDLTDDEDDVELTSQDGARQVAISKPQTHTSTSTPQTSQVDGLSQGSQRSNSGTSKHKGTSAMDVVGHNTGGEEDIRSEAIPGCSRSFMEELATAPEDEQFWSEQELGGASGGKKHAGLERNSTNIEVSKTPSAPKIVNTRSLSVEEFLSPAPITPMPPYDDMVTPELTKELGKYGVKKLRRKQARLKLKELYQFTHQVLEEDGEPDKSTDDNTLTKEKSLPGKKTAKSTVANKRSGKQQRKTKKMTEKPGSLSTSSDKDDGLAMFVEPKKVSKRKGATGKGKFSTKGGHSRESEKTLAGSLPEDAEAADPERDVSSQSSGSDDRDDFGESILFDEDQDEDVPLSQRTSDPEVSIQEFIFCNPKFHEKCLLFQPFDLDEFHRDLKANQIKVSKAQLMNILDAMCLTFRHKNRNRRSPKKSKRNQSPNKSKVKGSPNKSKVKGSPKKRVILSPRKSLAPTWK